MTKSTYILRENLMESLQTSIQCQEKKDKAEGFFTDSGIVAGWKETIKALEAGENVIIKN